MANTNHVIVNGETILDLRSDTVTPETLQKGYTAHDKSGTKITGTLESSSTGTDTPVDVRVNAITADRYQCILEEQKVTLDLSGLITGDCFICVFCFSGVTIDSGISFGGVIVLQHISPDSGADYDASGFGLFKRRNGDDGVENITAYLESGSDHVYDISSDFVTLYDSEGNNIANCTITKVDSSCVVSWS